MPIITCDCDGKLSVCSPCKLNVVGYVAGWLGFIWRIVVITLLSTTISKVTDYDPSIYMMFLATCLSYVLTSFLVNCIFIYGIYMKKRYFMIPYMCLLALETLLSVIILSGIIMLFFAVNAIILAIYTICIAIVIIGINFSLWIYTILLYSDFEYKALITREKLNNITLTRMYSINSYT